MQIELDEKTVRDIEDAQRYLEDDSFLIHCGCDLIRLYNEVKRREDELGRS